MIRAPAVLLAVLSVVAIPMAPVQAQTTKPTVLLLDGLGVYMENAYVGVSPLAAQLRRQGYRTVVDTHLMMKSAQLKPDIIIGHSMGGTAALRRAREMARAGEGEPYVFTIDAAPGSPPCPVARCVNIHSPGFPDIGGAQNIDAWDAGARLVPHALLATNEAVQRLILDRTASLMPELVSRSERENAAALAPLPLAQPSIR